MRVGQRDQLARIGGIGEDLLIAGHGGIEDHLANGFTGGTHGVAVKNAAVLERKQSGYGHGVDRLSDTAKSASQGGLSHFKGR